MKIIRQRILDAFHNRTPIIVSKVNPSLKKDVYYFNAYSFIDDVSEMLTFDINDADAVSLADVLRRRFSAIHCWRNSFYGK